MKKLTALLCSGVLAAGLFFAGCQEKDNSKETAGEVSEREELKKALEEAIANKENGVILLTEKFGKEFPDIIDDVRLNHRLPLLVEIPDRHGTGRAPDFITSYVNEAIGLKL